MIMIYKKTVKWLQQLEVRPDVPNVKSIIIIIIIIIISVYLSS